MTEIRLRKQIFVLLGVTVLLMAAMPLAGIYWFTEKQQEKLVQAQVKRVDELFREEWKKESRLLGQLIEAIEQESCIQNAFAARDRERLLRCSKSIYTEVNAKYQVTHLYFHGLNKVNFLRVHHPLRHGDRVKRFTLDEAVERVKPVSGIEIGTFGIFTLRNVHPFRVNGELVGYVEIGKEITNITRRLKEILDVELLFAIDKQFTVRSAWEEGQKIMGHSGDWDEFPNVVVIDRTKHIWTPELQHFTQHRHAGEVEHNFSLRAEGKYFHGNAVPLVDAGKRDVGHIIVLLDLTEEFVRKKELISYIAGGTLVIMILLMAFSWNYFRDVQNALNYLSRSIDEKDLMQHDAYKNLQQKNLMLNREVQQSQRALVEEQVLCKLMRLVYETSTLTTYLKASLEQIITTMVWIDLIPEGALFLAKKTNGREVLELAASYNFSPVLKKRCAQVQLGYCLCGRAAVSHEAIFADAVDERHDINFEEMVPHGHYVIPILKENSLLGVFTLYLPNGAVRDKRDEYFLKRVAEVFGLGIEMRSDSPTQVGNRN